jgi:hypothetical protein
MPARACKASRAEVETDRGLAKALAPMKGTNHGDVGGTVDPAWARSSSAQGMSQAAAST